VRIRIYLYVQYAHTMFHVEHLYIQLVYWRASGISATGGVTMGAMVASASDGICGSGFQGDGQHLIHVVDEV